MDEPKAEPSDQEMIDALAEIVDAIQSHKKTLDDHSKALRHLLDIYSEFHNRTVDLKKRVTAIEQHLSRKVVMPGNGRRLS